MKWVSLFFGDQEGINDVQPAQEAANNGQQNGLVPVPGNNDCDDGAKAYARSVVNRLVINRGARAGDDAGGEQENGEQNGGDRFDCHKGIYSTIIPSLGPGHSRAPLLARYFYSILY